MRAVDFDPWLETAVSDVLESMCFFSVAGDANDHLTHSSQEWICGTLEFRGVPNGTFGIGLPAHTARTLAANFLGEEEPDLDPKQITDTICEVANMMCGALLARLEPKQTFLLTSPMPCERMSDAAADEDHIARTFLLDDGSIHTWLEITNPA